MNAPALSWAFRLLLLAVLGLPLALGGQRPWAWNTFAVLIALACLIVAVRAWRDGQLAVPAVRLVPILLPAGIALCWAALQGSAWPPTAFAHPLWQEAAATLGQDIAGRISLDPAMTGQALVRALAFGAVFVLAVLLGTDPARARLALLCFVGAGAAYAAYGLVVSFAGSETILWMHKDAYLGDLTSTFVNRNSYGAFAGMGLIASLGLLAQSLRPVLAGRHAGAHDVAETLLLRAAPLLGAAVLMGTALMLSHSRGAFLCTVLGLVTLAVGIGAARLLRPGHALGLGLAALCIGFAVMALSGDGTLWRLSDTLERVAAAPERMAEDARLPLNQLTLQAIADAPWTGHGFGAFAAAFRLYRGPELASPLTWDFAHNTYLELAMDLGIPGALVFLAGPALALLACARGIVRRRRSQVFPLVALSAGVMLGAHGIVDFSPQIPGVAASFALLLGVGYAQSWSTRDAQA